MKRVNDVVVLSAPVYVLGNAACAGKLEGEGPLGKSFDKTFENPMLNQDSWEKAESLLQNTAFTLALEKAGISEEDVDLILAGDLLNQCVASSYAVRGADIPFVGLYGACSTMALSTLLASILVDCGAARIASAVTSSHFCTAERQYRTPLDYGGQRTPTAQHTVTGSGALILSREKKRQSPYISKLLVGKICDLGITDANNMGAAMAPAAAQTISRFLRGTRTMPEDYDLILTGDLAAVGTTLLYELLKKEGIDITGVHKDCGNMIYRSDKQDVHAGGSGCGCSASVLCSHILGLMNGGSLGRVLFVGTGSLQSPLSVAQGESIPSIAHAVLFEREKG